MKFLYILIALFVTLSADINTERFASFSISNGDLQLENGYYLESIDLYHSAYEASENSEIKAQALLREANLFALYLDDKKKAITLYKKLLDTYPHVSTVEYASYSLGMLYKDIGKRDAAIETFQTYVQNFPNGKFLNQIRFFLARVLKQKELIPKSNPLKIDTLQKMPTLRVLLTRKKSVTLSSSSGIVLNNQSYKDVSAKYHNGYVVVNGQKYKQVTLSSQTPIYVKNKKKRYKGQMLLTSYKNRLALVNVVPMNEYLYGVVTSESFRSWKMEALKSQAVASRTYAYYQSKVRKNWVFDIKDNTSDQVYNGVNGETKESRKAVDTTLGQVLLSNDKVIFSQYTASSGWHSASSKEIFNADKSYLYAHQDNFSKVMPNGRWKKKISIRQFEKNLNRQGFDFQSIYALEPVKVGESGRVLTIKVKASNGEKVLRTYATVRKAANLKDILFQVKKVNGYFFFEGGGFGHGVGYSQWGGQKMAKEGYAYDEILKFYYDDVVLKKLWSSR